MSLKRKNQPEDKNAANNIRVAMISAIAIVIVAIITAASFITIAIIDFHDENVIAIKFIRDEVILPNLPLQESLVSTQTNTSSCSFRQGNFYIANNNNYHINDLYNIAYYGANLVVQTNDINYPFQFTPEEVTRGQWYKLGDFPILACMEKSNPAAILIKYPN